MQFRDLDTRMRAFETAHDVHVPAGVHMVARLDGRSFTRLTKELHDFETPFDARFRDCMEATARHLMDCGFRVSFAYTQSDEISLLLAPDETSFDRKLRKLYSVLAGEASATFALALGAHAVFDCRISQLPDLGAVIDYFRWRSQDAARNCLSAHCYWRRRGRGESPKQAAAAIEGLDMDAKIAMLRELGEEFEALPAWQRRGSIFQWQDYEKEGFNPKTGEATKALRRRIAVDRALPSGPELTSYFESLIERTYKASAEVDGPT